MVQVRVVDSPAFGTCLRLILGHHFEWRADADYGRYDLAFRRQDTGRTVSALLQPGASLPFCGLALVVVTPSPSISRSLCAVR
jgi:hypothetical protein